jgi:multimeric flavodoxin WrbA
VYRRYIPEMNITPCTGCLSCAKTGSCVFHDDMTDLISDIAASSLVTFSFPLYFTSLPGPLKNMIDRLQPVWQENRLPAAEKRERALSSIAFITAGSSYNDMFGPSVRILSHAVKTLGGSFDREHSVFCENTDSPDSPYLYKKALERAASLPQILHIGD